MNERIDVLVVAEKPGVARAFARYLSKGRARAKRVAGVPVYVFSRNGETWACMGVSGHLMDYDFPEEYNKWRYVDPRQLFFVEPVRVLREGSGKYVKALRILGRHAKRVILAPDADVEGESIAFEVMDVLKRVNPRASFERARFNAVTERDLRRAVEELSRPDRKLAEKAFTRMKIDLTIGAAFTRALTLLVERGDPRALPRGKFLSYGPCQTPVLFLVVQRALERERFQKRKYYVVEATAVVGGVELKLSCTRGPIDKKEEALELRSKAKRAEGGVVKLAEYWHEDVLPPEPLNTVELERRASKFLDVRPREAMDVAEDLYQEGLISYPRTETTIYPPTLDLIEIARSFSKHSVYGRYVRGLLSRGDIAPRQGREDDKAHPPIVPLKSVEREYVVKRFGERGWRLYDLVVRHFLATLSSLAVVEKQRIVAEFGGVEFEVRGLRVLREGFYRIYPFEIPRERALPYVVEGDPVELVEVGVAERTTRPPPYLSESELLRLMKRYGIGTDATMQDHIQTNVERKYFVVRNKRCIPTPLGKVLATSLHGIVPEIVVPEVRGRIERELASIAEGARRGGEVFRRVREEFLRYYDKLMAGRELLSERLLSALREVYKVKSA